MVHERGWFNAQNFHQFKGSRRSVGTLRQKEKQHLLVIEQGVV